MMRMTTFLNIQTDYKKGVQGNSNLTTSNIGSDGGREFVRDSFKRCNPFTVPLIAQDSSQLSDDEIKARSAIEIRIRKAKLDPDVHYLSNQFGQMKIGSIVYITNDEELLNRVMQYHSPRYPNARMTFEPGKHKIKVVCTKV